MKLIKNKIDKPEICFICENALGGINIVIIGLYKLLYKEYRFKVILIDYSWRQVSSANFLYKDLNIDIVNVFLDNSSNKYLKLKQLSEEMKNSHIIIASDRYELIAYSLGKLTIPLILMIHGDSLLENKLMLDFKGIIDCYIPISNKIYINALNTLGDAYKDKIRYLPHVLPELELPLSNPFSKDFVVAFIGRFNNFKGVNQLKIIGEKLYAEKIKIKFIIITNGVNESEFRKEWAYDNSTEYYSRIDNYKVQFLLSQCNTLLMPSTGGEGFPVVLVEGMRRGVVPICSDIRTAFPEVIDHEDNGYICPLSDLNKFAEAIINLKNDRKLLSELSANAKRTVSEKFDPGKNAKRYQEVFSKVLSANISLKKYPDYTKFLGKLDKKYYPNWLVILTKKIIKKIKLS